jgi:hypothetical protein
MNLIPGMSWSPSESATVHEFLNTEVGRKWLGVLMLRKPKMDLSSTERAALSGAFASGYESVFGIIAETRTTRAPAIDASIKSIEPERD